MMRTFPKYHLPVILYAVVILVVPSLANLKAPAIRFLATDKIAHFLEYAVLALLAFRSISHTRRELGVRLVFWASFLVVVVFGLVDEGLQRLVPGRHSDLWDYAADLTGGLAGLVVLWLWRSRRAPAR